jgi:hypothetical protein
MPRPPFSSAGEEVSNVKSNSTPGTVLQVRNWERGSVELIEPKPKSLVLKLKTPLWGEYILDPFEKLVNWA